MNSADISKWPSELLSEAVAIWTGFGYTAWPHRDKGRLEQRFGTDQTAMLLPVIRYLESQFYASDACKKAVDLAEMGRIAREDFKIHFPNITDEIVDAFAWCYTFDFK